MLSFQTQLAMPTPRLNGPSTGPGETPKPKSGRLKYGNLLAQKFHVAHQQVNLDLDLCNKRVFGYTELSIVPTSTSLRTIRLDARAMTIKKVTVNGSELTNYVYEDLLYINNPETFEECTKLRIPNIWDEYSSEFSIHQHHLLRQKLSYIFGHLDDDQVTSAEKYENLNTEELTILLPENFKMEPTDANALLYTPNSAIPTTSLTPMLRLRGGSNEVFNPIQIGIEYELINPQDGLNFACNHATDKRMWHVYTSNSDYNVSASSWVPCIDNLLERSSWSIELSIPRSVKDIHDNFIHEVTGKSGVTDMEAKPTRDMSSPKSGIQKETKDPDVTSDSDIEIQIEEDDDDQENLDLFVCSGDFNNTKEAPHPTDITKKLVSWSVYNPVCAHHIGWSVGAYQSIELSDFNDGSTQLPELEEEFEEMEKDETSSSVSLFYLPGQEEMVKNTCIFAQKALDFFLKEYGSYPFSSYGIAFVQDPRYEKNNFAGLSLLSTDLLYPATIIEPMFMVTEDILECIAGQWSGISIVPLTFNDLWCTIGIAKFMTFQFMKTLVGLNEFRYQIRKKMSAIVELDIGQRPLGLQAFQAPISENSFDFIRLKAPVILFILDRRMTKTDKSFGFTRVLPKLFLQAMSGDLQNGALSTLHFQYVCEKVNRNRLESFFKQWIFGVGTPIFNITQKFNKKRSLIEVVIRQSQLQQAKTPHPKAETFVRDAVSLLNQEQTFPVQQTFLGPMTLRVHEADGTPYEHIVDIKDKVVKFDVQYNTKYKRLKKAKDDAGEGTLVFSKLGDVLQEEEDLRTWNFEEWPKRDEESFDPFEWLRVDTDYEWIATFNLKQPDYMYGSQLQQDRDIDAQINACNFFGLQEKPAIVHCTILTRTLIDRRYFYGVRIAAAKALANVSKSSNQFIGLNYLIRAFKHLYCFENSFIPKANNFQDFGEFFLQKAIPEILADVKDENGLSPSKVKALLFNLLKYNDNLNNDFQDCYYVSSLVRALAKSVIPINEDGSVIENHTNTVSEFETESKDQKFLRKVIEEIERIQKLDFWVPSYQSMVSNTCLEQKIVLARSNLCTLTFEDLLHFTHPKFSYRQRLLAFEGLLLLGGLRNAEVLRYFLQVCLLDNTSPHFRTCMINTLVKSISEAAVHSLPSTLDDIEFQQTNDELKSDGKIASTNNMIVVEENQTSEMNIRRDAFARATVKGAIQVLRRDLAIGIGLQNSLWELLHSSLLSLGDRKTIFVLFDILYEAAASYPITISVPCVPFEELKKKIVAKVITDGVVTIKREARFKIQLSAKAHSSDNKSKPIMATERKEDRAKPIETTPVGQNDPLLATGKLKLKISSSATSKPSQPLKLHLPLSSSLLVTIDPLDSMKVKFKIGKEKLITLKDRFHVKIPVYLEGSTIRFCFQTQKNRERLSAMRLTEGPRRYVKIHTKEKTIKVSREPFTVTEEFPITEDNDEVKENMYSTDGSGAAEITSPVISSEVGEAAEHKSLKTITDRECIERANLANTNHVPTALEKPNLTKKTTLDEPASEHSRAASPFSREPSPGKLSRRKKTNIYIHGRSPASSSTSGLNDRIGSHEVATEQTETGSEGSEKSVEAPRNMDTAVHAETHAPAEEPKRKLKLKLSLK